MIMDEIDGLVRYIIIAGILLSNWCWQRMVMQA